MNRLAASLCLAPFVLALTACDFDFDEGGEARHKEDFHYTYNLKSSGRLELESFNGSVEITGWDKESIDISGTKYANTEDRLKALKVEITNTPDSVRIKTIRPTERHGNMGVRFVISVPRKILLDRIASSNGSIRVQQVEGNGRFKTSNGSVRASNIKGDLDISTSNGSVELSEFVGGVVAHTSNGSVKATGVRGYFEATTSNGSIDAHVIEASAGRPIRIESSNGKVVLQVDSLKNDIIASTSNSSITVKLPATMSAKLKASTSNAGIQSDFDVTTSGAISKHRLEGTIGSGGPMLDLHSSNGTIRIVKM